MGLRPCQLRVGFGLVCNPAYHPSLERCLLQPLLTNKPGCLVLYTVTRYHLRLWHAACGVSKTSGVTTRIPRRCTSWLSAEPSRGLATAVSTEAFLLDISEQVPQAVRISFDFWKMTSWPYSAGAPGVGFPNFWIICSWDVLCLQSAPYSENFQRDHRVPGCPHAEPCISLGR